jgi:hypothetical protein
MRFRLQRSRQQTQVTEYMKYGLAARESRRKKFAACSAQAVPAQEPELSRAKANVNAQHRINASCTDAHSYHRRTTAAVLMNYSPDQ